MTDTGLSQAHNRSDRQWLAIATIATIAALLLRNAFRGFVSYDMFYFYIPWSEHLEAHGGFYGIPSLQSDYTVAYQYILAFLTYLPASYLAKVKVVSVFFDLVNALLIFFIVKKVLGPAQGNKWPTIAYLIALIVPTVVLNSAVWGQCDAIYTAFVLASILAILHLRYPLAFIAYGVALAFKLQAIFFLPVLGLLWLKQRRFSLLNFAFIPLVNFLLYLPAWLLGKPLSQFFDAYFVQVTQYSDLTRRFPSLWQWIENPQPWMNTLALTVTFLTLGLLYITILRRPKLQLQGVKLIELSMLTVMICLLLLPTMHERYMYLADSLAAAYLVLKPRKWFIPIIIWFTSLVGYLDVLFGIGPLLPYKWVALFLLAGCTFLAHALLSPKQSAKSQIT